jgi:3-oxoacyl-[acyl-carrier protein] reductase
MRFKERVALVTGGSRGIGKAIARSFAAEGAHVVFTYKSSKGAADELVRELKEFRVRAEAIQHDAIDFKGAVQVVEYVVQTFGAIDILVNNAGMTRDQLLLRMSESDWDEVIANNLKSVYNFSKAVLRPMMGKRYGKIISLSSIVGITGNAGQTNYAAAKAGIIGFTKALAKEVASRNITVNVVAPGFIKTDLTGKLSEDQTKKLIEYIPMKKLGSVEDVARAVSFLASGDADYISGQVFCVDGGMVM